MRIRTGLRKFVNALLMVGVTTLTLLGIALMTLYLLLTKPREVMSDG